MAATPPWDDQLFMDGREAVTYRSVRTAGDVTVAVANAVRQPVSVRELAASGGVYQAGDESWTVSIRELGAVTPKPADRIEPAGENARTVLTASKAVLGGFWRLTARDLALALGLRDSITVQTPTVTKDATGATLKTWTTKYANVAARVQPDESDLADERDVTGLRTRYTVTVGQELSLTAEDRVLWGAVVLDIDGYERARRIDELPAVRCHRKP